MPIQLWACLAATCTTIYYRTVDGKCPRCGEDGHRVLVPIRPPK